MIGHLLFVAWLFTLILMGFSGLLLIRSGWGDLYKWTGELILGLSFGLICLLVYLDIAHGLVRTLGEI